MNAVLMSVKGERFVTDLRQLAKSKRLFVTAMLHLSLSVCVAF
jgi:hypothetical protein